MSIYSIVKEIYGYEHDEHYDIYIKQKTKTPTIISGTYNHSVNLIDGQFSFSEDLQTVSLDEARDFASFIINNTALYFEGKEKNEVEYMWAYFSERYWNPIKGLISLIVCLYYLEYIGFFD